MAERDGVLLIENDADIAMLLLDILDAAGMPTTLRSDPQQLSEDLHPRVVVTDLYGPDWYEQQAAASHMATLRARFPDVPIIVVTAFGEAEKDTAALGARAVVMKPFDVEVLSQLVLSLYDSGAAAGDGTMGGTLALNP